MFMLTLVYVSLILVAEVSCTDAFSPVQLSLKASATGSLSIKMNLLKLRAGAIGSMDPVLVQDFLRTHGFPAEEAIKLKTQTQLYQPDILHRGGWRSRKVGTLLNSVPLLKQLSLLMFIALLSGAIGWKYATAVDMAFYEHLEDALHALIIFFLGFFVSNVYGRWFSLFSGPYGAIWGAINGCAIYGNQYIKGPDKTKIILQNLRWGLLSHALLFKDASGENDMDDLLARKLCTPKEKQIIEDACKNIPGASRPKIPWKWVADSFSLAERNEELLDSGTTCNLDILHGKCTAATGGIGAIMGSLNQKLPLPYVHLLTVMAKFNMYLMSVTRGVAIASHIKYGLLDPRVTNMHAILQLVVDTCRLIFLPLVYQGCFELHTMMANPFDRKKPDNPVRFPEMFYHWKILGESLALTDVVEYPGQEKVKSK